MTEQQKIVSATAEVAAPAATLFEYVADPTQQVRFDGNDNLGSAEPGQRVHGVGEVFVMTLTKGSERANEVVEFDEGRRIAWKPSPVGEPQPGQLWRWEFEPLDEHRTRVTHTYDWSALTDEKRLERARATTSEKLRASVLRLKELAEGETGTC